VIPESPFLFAVAAVSMSLASLAGLVVGFRRSGSWAAHDTYRLRQIVEFGFANALLALALIPLVPTVGSADVAVRFIAGVALAYFGIGSVVLLRRWRALSLTGFPRGIVAFDLVLLALLLNAIVTPNVTAWEWALLAFVARPMLAFLLVLATLRPESD
jgi:hypothetical protein